MGLEPEAEHIYKAAYSITAKEGTLNNAYNLLFGGENATLKNGRLTRG